MDVVNMVNMVLFVVWPGVFFVQTYHSAFQTRHTVCPLVRSDEYHISSLSRDNFQYQTCIPLLQAFLA
jgi:hypothetical protein